MQEIDTIPYESGSDEMVSVYRASELMNMSIEQFRKNYKKWGGDIPCCEDGKKVHISKEYYSLADVKLLRIVWLWRACSLKHGFRNKSDILRGTPFRHKVFSKMNLLSWMNEMKKYDML